MVIEKIKNVSKKEWSLPFEEKIMRIIRSFSLTEKTIFVVFIGILIISSLVLLFRVNKLFLVQVPEYGGTMIEGVIGTPRFINPLLAISDIDKDLTTLIYSGLLKTDSDGKLVPDLAETYSISEDSLTYTFVLRDDIYFHDGVRVTSDDVLYTIEKTRDPLLKSPREANWSGVTVQKIDERTISFTLKQPYSPFIQNTTIGIIPEHIWKSISIEEFPFSQFNIRPIGSGPYKIDSLKYTGSGLPSEYNLKSFNKYALGRPYITNFILKSYQNEKDLLDAYKKGDIDSMHSISPKELRDLKIPEDEIVLSPLPRIFGVFFNQNLAPVLAYKEVRSALDLATNKQLIIDTVLGGYGRVIDSPIPLKNVISGKLSTSTEQSKLEEARNLLAKNGWKLNANNVMEKTDKKETVRLSFSISTGNAPELKDTAYLLQKQWSELGAEVEVKIFEIGDLNQEIIKPRKYDSLLFGEIIGRDFDLYPFWHSSARNSPGLNIALYTNLRADRILENIRKTTNIEDQENYFEAFNKEIRNDMPAVFTYSPYFIYIVPDKVQNIKIGTLTTPAERYSDIGEWYIETNNVWEIFNKNNTN